MPDCASSVRFSLSIGWIVNRANVPAEASCEALVRNDGFRKTVESTICSREMLFGQFTSVAEHFSRTEKTLTRVKCFWMEGVMTISGPSLPILTRS
jgi:hypothetical protein